jgi:hypothetical protein
MERKLEKIKSGSRSTGKHPVKTDTGKRKKM